MQPLFIGGSYGYRPNRSAQMAIGKVKEYTEQGERLLKRSTIYLEDKLRLTVNKEKSKAVSVTAIRNFKFPGFAPGRGKDGYYIRVHAKSLKKAKQKLKELTSRSQGRNVQVIMQNLKVFMTGWLFHL